LIVAGLDVSTKGAHYAIWDGGRILSFGVMKSREDCENLSKADIAYIEEIPYCNNQRTAIRLSEAVGRWQERLDVMGLDFKMIPVALWKLQSIGTGKASKVQVQEMIKMTTNLKGNHPQDIYDACGVAIAGYNMERLDERVKA
jgi:Holliday junction resolvasome RuvABC endonuclease subunit